MSKSKSSSKAAKPAKPDVLTKVKDAAVTKPAQAIKAKSKDLAKMVVGKEEKKSKKGKKAKEPTPEPSESEDSDSSASSESESEDETKPVSNGKAKNAKPAPKADSSDDSESDAASDSDSSEEEAPKANGNAKKAEPVKAKAAADSSDESEDDSSEDEQTAKKSAVAAAKPEPTAESDGSDSDSSDSSDDDDEEVAAKPTKRKAEDEAEPTAKKTKTEAVDTSKGANLFVGNLSWNIDEAWLKEAFEEHGEVSSARIVTDRETGRSRGFGYVEFVNAEDASKAQAAKHGAELDGRNLNVDFGNTRPDKSQQQENRRKSYGDQVSEQSDTLFIGNLSFDVGQESVTEAFQSHGTILGIRLPTDRETGQPKGFGYVTFASVEESAAALEAMQGAYISGRPIRLDYSSPRPQNSDSPARGRGGFGGGRGGGRGFGGRGGRGGRGGDRGFGGRGGRGGRGGSTNRGGFGDFSGRKTNFD